MGVGALDGGWWPQSRDLSVELPDLVDNFPVALGRVQRVVFSRPDWDTAPHRVRAARGLVKVGSYPHDDTQQVWLSMSTHTIIRLSVTPAEGPAEPPTPAGDGGQGRNLDAGSQWNDDGGSWWDPHPVPPSERI